MFFKNTKILAYFWSKGRSPEKSLSDPENIKTLSPEIIPYGDCINISFRKDSQFLGIYDQHIELPKCRIG